jgi:hypothetical protein
LILDQVAGGVAVRMSVLYELLGGDDEESPVVGAGERPARRAPAAAAQPVPEGVGV